MTLQILSQETATHFFDKIFSGCLWLCLSHICQSCLYRSIYSFSFSGKITIDQNYLIFGWLVPSPAEVHPYPGAPLAHLPHSKCVRHCGRGGGEVHHSHWQPKKGSETFLFSTSWLFCLFSQLQGAMACSLSSSSSHFLSSIILSGSLSLRLR